LPIGPAVGQVVGAAAVERPRGPALHVRLGPRDDWFTTAARALLLSAEWTVCSDSDRVGVRLDGPPLERAHPGELPSEPTLPGAVQVPTGGRPILFGPDAPVTGGYPVIAVVDDPDPVAQLRPGDRLRFSRGTG
jgi:allophanate hydrolase subunit 2